MTRLGAQYSVVCASKYPFKNAYLAALSAAANGAKWSPSSIDTGFDVRNAYHTGRPWPFGLPVAAKFATYDDVVSAIAWSAAVHGRSVPYRLPKR